MDSNDQKQAMIVLTEDEFEERFRPIEDEDGGALTDDLWHGIPAGVDPACVWTAVDTDTGTAWLSGWHRVNRYAHLICEVPVPDGEQYCVEFPDADDLPD